MSFDRSDPADLLALKTEVNSDPIGMGYDATGPTKAILDLLNEPASNVGGETTGEDLTVNLLLAAIDPNELTVGGQFTEGELAWLKLVVESTQSPEENIEQHRAKITALFQPSDQTRVDLEAQSRAMSRAEVRFGIGTNISRQDWFSARDS